MNSCQTKRTMFLEHCTLENQFPRHSQKVNHLVNMLLNKMLSLAIFNQSVNETAITSDNGFPPMYDPQPPKMMIGDGSHREMSELMNN